MSVPIDHGGGFFDTPAARFPRFRRRHMLLFLAVSCVLHAILLAVAPSLTAERPLTRLSALEVVLTSPEPLPVASPAPPAAAPPQTGRKRVPEQVAISPAATPVSRQAAGTTVPVLPLPDSPAPAEADFSVVPPGPTEARVPPAEVKNAPAAAPVIPPGFNAAYLHNPRPRYPLVAHRAGVQGTVMLKVLVTREGLPARVDVERTSGSIHLDSAALEAVKTWRFVPARQGTEPIEAWVLVPLTFRLDGSS